jgi:hypothetical protein
MIRRIPLMVLSLLMVSRIEADTVTYNDGTVSTVRLVGFTNRKFDFKGGDGSSFSEYPLKIKSIVPDSPATVSLQLSRKQYDAVTLVQFDHNTLRLKKDGQAMDEPVIMLKSMAVVETKPEEVAASPERPVAADPRGVASAKMPATREWHGTGKWAEVQDDKTPVISRGEVVNVEASLKPGYINIVHFHMPQAVASIREGNYVQSLAAKRTSRIVVLKVVVPHFGTPICSALNLKSLPQFWFYDSRGKLVKKLTDRFTEGDIDAAVKEARSF